MATNDTIDPRYATSQSQFRPIAAAQPRAFAPQQLLQPRPTQTQLPPPPPPPSQQHIPPQAPQQQHLQQQPQQQHQSQPGYHAHPPPRSSQQPYIAPQILQPQLQQQEEQHQQQRQPQRPRAPPRSRNIHQVYPPLEGEPPPKPVQRLPRSSPAKPPKTHRVYDVLPSTSTPKPPIASALFPLNTLSVEAIAGPSPRTTNDKDHPNANNNRHMAVDGRRFAAVEQNVLKLIDLVQLMLNRQEELNDRAHAREQNLEQQAAAVQHRRSRRLAHEEGDLLELGGDYDEILDEDELEHGYDDDEEDEDGGDDEDEEEATAVELSSRHVRTTTHLNLNNAIELQASSRNDPLINGSHQLAPGPFTGPSGANMGSTPDMAYPPLGFQFRMHFGATKPFEGLRENVNAWAAPHGFSLATSRSSRRSGERLRCMMRCICGGDKKTLSIVDENGEKLVMTRSGQLRKPFRKRTSRKTNCGYSFILLETAKDSGVFEVRYHPPPKYCLPHNHPPLEIDPRKTRGIKSGPRRRPGAALREAAAAVAAAEAAANMMVDVSP